MILSAWPPRTELLLVLDFDGTLVPFTMTPSEAQLPSEHREIVETLAQRPGISVAVLSGRRVMDLRQRTHLSQRITHGGIHGLELERPTGRWLHPAVLAATRAVATLVAAYRELASRYPGALVEDKQYSVAFHVRGVAEPERPAALRAAADTAATSVPNGVLRPEPGALVCEYRAAIDWDKGDALGVLRHDARQRSGQPAWCVYIGDDLTDEHAFAALADGELGFVVDDRPSAAHARIDGVPSVIALLARLAERVPPPGDPPSSRP